MADWTRGLQGGIGGGLAGAQTGNPYVAAGGALAGGLLGLFGGGSDDEANARRQQLIDLWQQRLQELSNPDGQQQEAEGKLLQLARTGLTPESRAAFLQSQIEASNLARSRQGAIAADAAARGGGVASGGQSAVLQAQASQDAAQRAQIADTSIAAHASSAQRDAIAEYLGQRARNEQMKLQASGGLTGALGGAQDLAERQHYAQSGNLDSLMNNAGAFGSYMAQKRTMPSGPGGAPGGAAIPAPSGIPNLTLGNSPLTSGQGGYFNFTGSAPPLAPAGGSPAIDPWSTNQQLGPTGSPMMQQPMGPTAPAMSALPSRFHNPFEMGDYNAGPRRVMIPGRDQSDVSSYGR